MLYNSLICPETYFLNGGQTIMNTQFMKRAIELGKKGYGHVNPNPIVGCVIVKDGKVIGEGYHEMYGQNHAERNAIKNAKENNNDDSLKGSTMYVTLEPCCHYGKTPPCTEALLWAGVKRVVIGADDPNPPVRGDGASALEKSVVEVEAGFLVEECGEKMREFMHWRENRRPQVLMKAAM